MGLFQSFGDAVKLFIREQSSPIYSNISLYYFAPVLAMIMILTIWLVFPLDFEGVGFTYAMVYIFSCLVIGVYVLMLRGWSSNSNYALIGAIRGVSQTISYEVSLVFLILSVVVMIKGFRLSVLDRVQEYIWFSLILVPVFLGWVVTMLAETNRTPFDFSEGESELVSGFNIEYGRGGFALLFLAEYGIIIFMRYLMVLVFLGGFSRLLVVNIKGLILCFYFLWVRGILPRFRYDKLMYLVWRGILPVSLNYFMVVILFRLLN